MLQQLTRSARLTAAALAVASFLAPSEAATQQNGASSAILFQGFHWNSYSYSSPNWYNTLAGKASDLKDLGITHVWFPPPSDSGDNNGYLPRQLSILSNKYGSASDLTSAISAMSGQGIQSIADIVINHRVGTADWADFTNPTWGCSAVVSNDEWTGHCGNADTGDSYGSARDIDHTQSFVQTDIKTWLAQLKSAGFTGIRYDFAKGYAPSYAKLYHDSISPDFCVGEIWTDLDYNNVDAHRQLLMNYIDGTSGACAAFDFTTHGLLVEVLTNNDYGRLMDSSSKPAGAIGWWAQKSVTFVDNHDTGGAETSTSGQNLWPVPAGSVMQAYAYILTHPGIPMVYYPHVYNWNLRTAIKSLIDARKAAGVTSTSAIAIQQATTGLYAAIITGTSAKLAMKIGPNSWSPTGTWTLLASGTNYAVWKQ